MTERKRIPKIHAKSSEVYWTKIFPVNYFHKNDIDYENVHIQGDVVLGDDGIPCCALCGNKKFKPKFWGSIDVGFELIYECVFCEKGHHRVWSRE